MQELQNQQNLETQQLQEQIEQIENVAKSFMTSEALSRYGNLKAAHPEKALQSAIVIAQMAQQGKIQKVDDEMYKGLLMQMTEKKKEFKITRK